MFAAIDCASLEESAPDKTEVINCAERSLVAFSLPPFLSFIIVCPMAAIDS